MAIASLQFIEGCTVRSATETRLVHRLQAELSHNLSNISMNKEDMEKARDDDYKKVALLVGMLSVSTVNARAILVEFGQEEFLQEDDYYALLRLVQKLDGLNDRMASRDRLLHQLESRLDIHVSKRFHDLGEVDGILYGILVDSEMGVKEYLGVLNDSYRESYSLPAVRVAVAGATPFTL